MSLQIAITGFGREEINNAENTADLRVSIMYRVR